MKQIARVMLIIFLFILGVILLIIGFIAFRSPGKLDALTDENGNPIENSIARKDWVSIGGIRQGMFIRSENPENPVLLYLHGGPGSPELALTMPYEKSERLEKYFTVCYWDQRGAGMTFDSDTDTSTMTLDRLIEDTHEVTQFLKSNFGKQKIFVLGHSWGSFLGLKTIQKYPNDFYAYFGVGQVCNQLESERLAHRYMMQHAKEIGDNSAIKKLSKFDPNSPDFPNFRYMGSARGPLLNKYGIGIVHRDASMAKLVQNIFTFKGYTFGEKIGYMRGGLFSLKHLFWNVTAENLIETTTSFEVPVYVLHGKYDYQVSYTLAKQYLEKLVAPKKAFFTFEDSAHSPNVEESEKFVDIVKEIASDILKETEKDQKADDSALEDIYYE